MRVWRGGGASMGVRQRCKRHSLFLTALMVSTAALFRTAVAPISGTALAGAAPAAAPNPNQGARGQTYSRHSRGNPPGAVYCSWRMDFERFFVPHTARAARGATGPGAPGSPRRARRSVSLHGAEPAERSGRGAVRNRPYAPMYPSLWDIYTCGYAVRCLVMKPSSGLTRGRAAGGRGVFTGRARRRHRGAPAARAMAWGFRARAARTLPAVITGPLQSSSGL